MALLSSTDRLRLAFLGLAFAILAAPLCLVPFLSKGDAFGAGYRVAHPLPKPWRDESSWRDFPASFQAWYDDHFRLRGLYNRMYAYALWHAFRVSSGKVLVGREGWLYYDAPDDGDPIATYRGTNLFTAAQLGEIRDNLASWRDWLHARGIAFVVCVAPAKETIYPEFLPAGFAVADRPTRTSQFVAACREGGIDVVDLRPVVAKAKADNRGPVYLRTDTHWTPAGAFAGATALLERIGTRLPGVRPPQASDYETSVRPARPGDLEGLIGVGTGLSDTTVDYRPRFVPAAKAEASEHRKGIVAMEQPRPDLPRAVVFRDSFAAAMIPFLSPAFRRTLYIHDHQPDPALIGEEKPDIVVFEAVERYLGRTTEMLSPEEMLRRYPVSYYDVPAR